MRPGSITNVGAPANNRWGGAWNSAYNNPYWYYDSCYWNTWGGLWCNNWWGPWCGAGFYFSGFWWNSYWCNGGTWWPSSTIGFGYRRPWRSRFANLYFFGPFLSASDTFVVYEEEEQDPEVIIVEVPEGSDVTVVEGEAEVIAAPRPSPAGMPLAPAAGALAPEATEPSLQRELNRASAYYLTQGDRAFRESRFGDAVHFYAKAVEFAPESGILYLVLSDALFATGDYRYAAHALRQAFDKEPTLAANVVDKRDFYAEPATFEEQIRTLEKFVKDHTLDMDARLVLAANYLFGGRPGRGALPPGDPLQPGARHERRGSAPQGCRTANPRRARVHAALSDRRQAVGGPPRAALAAGLLFSRIEVRGAARVAPNPPEERGRRPDPVALLEGVRDAAARGRFGSRRHEHHDAAAESCAREARAVDPLRAMAASTSTSSSSHEHSYRDWNERWVSVIRAPRVSKSSARKASRARKRPRHLPHDVAGALGDVGLEFVGVSIHDLLRDVPHDGRPLRMGAEAVEGGPALRDAPVELAAREGPLHAAVHDADRELLEIEREMFEGLVLAVEPQDAALGCEPDGVGIHDPALHADESPLGVEGSSDALQRIETETEGSVERERRPDGDRGGAREARPDRQVASEEQIDAAVERLWPRGEDRAHHAERIVEPLARGCGRQAGDPLRSPPHRRRSPSAADPLRRRARRPAGR